ncbi:MAG: lytic transglycosylase domain-containing protein [Deltaproteobacteria bacterium]|nr:lytic transglycosylase domain-containing protein [Deltaproteobacteria bacterium]
MLVRIDREKVAAAAATQEGAKQATEGNFRGQLDRAGASPRAPSSPRSASRGGGGRSLGISLLHAERLAYWAPLIKQNAAKYGVPIDLICGVMLQESGGNPRARSHCGATGLMQLMPATARRFGVTNIWDPRQNVEGGVRYLRYLLDHFRGNSTLVVAAYNSGEGNVAKYRGIPPFKETQNYVPSVMQFARSVGSILRGGAGIPMRALIRSSMPTHAIANFNLAPTPTRPATPPPQAIATRFARL